MKIIVGEPLANSNNTAYQTLDIIRKSARISTLADTTLTTHGKPVFVPRLGRKMQCGALCGSKDKPFGEKAFPNASQKDITTH